MRRLIMWNLLSLDGYFEGERPWDLPWHEVAWGEGLERLSLEQLASADFLVFGRATYEGMATHFSTAEGVIAEAMNRLPKIVCSRTLTRADWQNSTVVQDAVSAIERLKAQGDGNMFVFGSADLSASLIEADLFDEYRLGYAPVLHGRGRLLFRQGLPERPLALAECRTLSNGCVILFHHRDDRKRQ